MLAFFFDQDGPLLINVLQFGTTVNAQRHSQILTTFRQAIKSKRPGKLIRGVILLHENARPHTANTNKAPLQKFKWEVLCHSPYSPELSPCDYTIFGPLKRLWGVNDPPRTTTSSSNLRAELVQNAATGILRDSRSPPCIAVGQVPQKSGPIFLTYRYWFLFLGLRLVSFLMPLIQRTRRTLDPLQSNGMSHVIKSAFCTLPLETFSPQNFGEISDK